jgi:hypothetical protein
MTQTDTSPRPITADLNAVADTTTRNGVASQNQPHIVLIVPRGEAVRNVLYSDTLKVLSTQARLTLLSVVDDEDFRSRFVSQVERFVTLRELEQAKAVGYLRAALEDAHFRWLWSAVARNKWERHDIMARRKGRQLFRLGEKTLARMLGIRPVLESLTKVEQALTYKMRPTDQFDKLFADIKPDLVFNASHIHGFAGELPARVASKIGIPTAGFVFSWDNLTSRSRILVPYDYYLVWTPEQKTLLRKIYPHVREENIFVTGSAQLDFHFKPEFQLSREELCERIGVDPARPYILWTTGIHTHFREEHKHILNVIEMLDKLDVPQKPQLVVRVYAKGASKEMLELAQQKIPDVFFPPVEWDKKWLMPHTNDLFTYTNQVRHAALSINAASTVTLEFLLLDKPVINLDFDPPGTNLHPSEGYARHIRFDHFWPVAQSGATMVAHSSEEMKQFLERGLNEPEADSGARQAFVEKFFAGFADGQAGERVGQTLLELARKHQKVSR